MPRWFEYILLALVAPVAIALGLFVSIVVRVGIGRPILFTQPRVGYMNSIFRLYKFRSMSDGRDENGELLPDDLRLTRFGKFLRSSSLDELPSLWNVLKGDMRLVGPRPLLVEYLPLYSPEQRRRHDVHPGLTGWAQVNGRNSLSWEQKFALDVWYVENRSFWLDVKILFLTVKKIVQRDGISAEGEATMPRFAGTKP